jgi:hypothetical protein
LQRDAPPEWPSSDHPNGALIFLFRPVSIATDVLADCFC